jgi:hypothetical protein
VNNERRPSAFYAYPSRPDHLIETIELAIDEINSRGVCEIKDWRSLNVTGRLVINTILKQIKACDLFVADVTGLNPNVLFELGFAVALDKRIWLTVDETNPKHVGVLDELPLVSDIGYVPHTNFEIIRDAFLDEYPWADLESTVLSEYSGIVESARTGYSQKDVFYLPSAIESTASKKLTKYLNGLRIKSVVDDPLENSYEPIAWYLSNALNSRTVIAHLQNAERGDHMVNNARYSFLSGLSRGFGIDVLMLAPEPFDPPFDYRGLLEVYRTGEQCVSKTKKWLVPKLVSSQERAGSTRRETEDPTTTLIKFHIGESIAENEEEDLVEYFLQTGYFVQGIDTKMGVFIGRKGSGKTANLYQIRRHFSLERNDLAVTVKPVSFRLESFVTLVSEIFAKRDSMADFVERIWRVVIYSDIAAELANRLVESPSYYDFSDDEEALLAHVEEHEEFIRADFGEKMDAILGLALEARANGDSPKSILGLITQRYADPLISVFQKVLRKFQRIVILVDNLDKAWDVHRNVDYQSQIIFGLLGFQNTMRRDVRWAEGDVRLLIFLREDIFTYVLKYAREPDKIRLSATRITWEDTDQLARLLENRFLQTTQIESQDGVWDELFCASVEGIETKTYLLSHVMPRPRDLIHVVKSAILSCVNRQHDRIEPIDIQDALRSYFNFLIDNLQTEYGLYYAGLRDTVMAFMGERYSHSYRQLRRVLRPVIAHNEDLWNTIDFLIHVSFLGLELSGSAEFAYSNENAEKLQVRARKSMRPAILKRQRFVVHPAFHHGLGIATFSGDSGSNITRRSS